MDGLMDARGESALAEIQERLTVIYNRMHMARDDIESAKAIIAHSQVELARLEKVANEYVALLVPEGNPA